MSVFVLAVSYGCSAARRWRTMIEMCNKKALGTEQSVEELLRRLGVIRTYKGCAYLVQAVKLALDGTTVDEVFYKAIAERVGGRRQNVYAAMQTCMRRAQQMNPAFLSTVMGISLESKELGLPMFIQNLAAWIERHEAVLQFNDKSFFGKIEWTEKIKAESCPQA